jgi:hypothetical protein
MPVPVSLAARLGQPVCLPPLPVVSMWEPILDRRKRRALTFKMDEKDYAILQEAAAELGISKGELLRRSVYVTRILFDPDLTVGMALSTTDPNVPLREALKPIPELAALVGYEFKMWKKWQEMRS